MIRAISSLRHLEAIDLLAFAALTLFLAGLLAAAGVWQLFVHSHLPV